MSLPHLIFFSSSLTFSVSEPPFLASSTAHVPSPHATSTFWSQTRLVIIKRRSNSSVFGMLHESLSITSNLTGVTFSKDHLYQFCFLWLGSRNGPWCHSSCHICWACLPHSAVNDTWASENRPRCVLILLTP